MDPQPVTTSASAPNLNRVNVRGGPQRGGPPRGGPGGSPRGGPPRGGPGAPRGAPGRGGPPRGGPRGAPRGAPRGGRFAGVGNNVTTPTTTPVVSTPAPQPVVEAKLTPIRSESAPTISVNKVEATPSPVASGGGAGGIGNRWAQQMAQQQQDDFQKNRDKLRGRRKGGVQFMDTQIRSLIKEIYRLSTGKGSGLAQVPFGVLFHETIDSMPALAATLNVAKKRDVLAFEGDMLMQGTHDHVMITLLKDEIEDTPDFQSIIGVAPIKLPQETVFQNTKCAVCDKTVYQLDRVCPNNQVLHKTCFRCCDCNSILQLAKFAYGGGKFYCETHYQKRFKESGGQTYNF